MKVLIIGLGSIARKHVAALRRLDPNVEICALRSGQSHCEIDGIRNIYNEEEIGEEFDFAIISNPTFKHAETLDSLVKRNIPLFIEKPVFYDLGHESLLKKLKLKGTTTYVACNLRFLDSISFLHDYLLTNKGRRINEVNVYCGSYLPEWRPGSDYKQCYSAIPEMGGGVHIDLIHEVDYVCWIFGKPVESYGFFRSRSSLNIRAVDYANYILAYPDFVASIILNYYRRDYKRTMEILYDDETWTLDLTTDKIVDQNGNIVFQGKVSPSDTYYEQMKYFVSLLQENKKAENDIENAYEVLKICLGNEKS